MSEPDNSFKPDAPYTEGEIEAGRLMFRRPWGFVTSVAHLEQLPPEAATEVAFAGRSNVGKSSLLNALVGQKGLAKASNTPGRTRALNLFAREDGVGPVIVDMPGYGYAKAPEPKVRAWTALIHQYLTGRATLRRVYVLIDSRHGAKDNDISVMNELDRAAVSYQVVMTKVDKPSAKDLESAVAKTRAAIAKRPAAHPDIIQTSSEKGTGLNQLRSEIALLLES